MGKHFNKRRMVEIMSKKDILTGCIEALGLFVVCAEMYILVLMLG